MRVLDEVVKTRNIGGRIMQMQVAHIKSENVYQATYYDLANPYIWGEAKATHEQAVESLENLVDETAKKYPLAFGSR